MKILHTEWSDGWGGQEIRILADAMVLTDMGHEVTLLVCPGGGLERNAREKGLPVIGMQIRHAYDFRALGRLVALFRREKYDVVNTHSSVDSWIAGAAAKITRIPVLVRTRHLSVPVSTNPFNVVYRWPDAIVTTAEMIRRRMIADNGVRPERIISIPTGIDLEKFDPGLDPGDIRGELGLAPEHRVVTMVAVLRSWKRHEIFLEAAARLIPDRPDLRFLVVGDGPGRKRVSNKIKELNIEDQVIMTGYRTDIPRILAVTEICALTSESSEGVPQSVLQYQAMARPVVASTAGGIPEVVQDEQTGLLCPINDSVAVAAAVGRLLDRPELAARLGRAGRRQVEEKHSLAAMASSTLELYRNIYRGKKGSRDL